MQRLIRSLIFILLLPFWGLSQLGPIIYLPASPVVINFTAPGLQTWVCPANVTQITVQCWGGGGGGGNSANNFVNGGSGGGGGVYAKTNTIFVMPGTTYYLNVDQKYQLILNS
jgi:hyaluronate lyase